ncbi:glycogen debranching protein GlgX [Variovorax ginsengisoli]|uniref:Glycogen debranching protein GlgX n=1 Tax=Variovorax ginsengisoli TaxID=363844 RepID=A0ABT8S4Y8_9BURK|nr:glycogen debranching protein GlgX [Variovorax ginsengisoli]MDN8614813.1 glycogen debranching protein GlgX [Variovorax ginsengisoli]MDO1533983.1 glycogen debranching protein GlgX [Variovorax ginsengisoli]
MNDGTPLPLGATASPDEVNFALAAPNATAVELCLFDGTGAHEQQRLRLQARTDGVWHARLPGARPGLVYGWRVHGPWSPAEGLRFNPAKLLLDPYAREIVGRYGGEDLFLGHDPAQPLQRDARDNAAIALKARVTTPLPAAPPGRSRIPAGERVLYEVHVRGQTRRHPGVPEALRGSYAGLAEPVVLDHLQRLGVTTLSLMPVQQRADESRLLALGLSNYWGYSTIGWFVPEVRYWSGRAGTTPASEFRALADAVHARGMELVIDVVYNHSAETDELGPTLSLRGIDNALYYHLRPDDRALYQNWTGCGNCLNLAEPRALALVMDSLRYWVCELGVDGFRFDLAPVLARGADGDFDPRAPFLAAIAQDPVLARTLLIAEPWDIGPGGYRLGEFPAGWLEWNDRFRDVQRGFWLQGIEGLGEFAHRFTASSDDFRRNARAPTASVSFITAHDGFTLRDLLSYNERHNLANGEGNRDGSGHNLSRNCGVEGETDDPAVRAERRRLQRVLLAVLLLSQGTPMLLAGDEIGHTQRGNNNAYCQDNDTTWLDWDRADGAMPAFVARLLALRREAAPLRSTQWWPAEAVPGTTALRWLAPEGHPMRNEDWQAGDRRAMAILFEAPPPAERWLVLLNAGTAPVGFTLPPGRWTCRLASDAADDEAAAQRLDATQTLAPGSLWVAKT